MPRHRTHIAALLIKRTLQERMHNMLVICSDTAWATSEIADILNKQDKKENRKSLLLSAGILLRGIYGMKRIESFFEFSASSRKDSGNLPLTPKINNVSKLKGVSTIVITEAQRLSARHLEFIDEQMRILALASNRKSESVRPFGGVQIILVADLLHEAFDNNRGGKSPWYRSFYGTDLFKASFITVQMADRKASKFKKFLFDIGLGREDALSDKELVYCIPQSHDTGYPNLASCAHAITVDSKKAEEINRYMLEAMEGEKYCLPAAEVKCQPARITRKEIKDILPPPLELKVGSLVLMSKRGYRYDTKTLGRVLEVSKLEKTVTVEFPQITGEVVVCEIKRKTFIAYKQVNRGGKSTRISVQYKQFPMKPANAITLSQANDMFLSGKIGYFLGNATKKGQVYSALSKASSLNDIILFEKIPDILPSEYVQLYLDTKENNLSYYMDISSQLDFDFLREPLEAGDLAKQLKGIGSPEDGVRRKPRLSKQQRKEISRHASRSTKGITGDEIHLLPHQEDLRQEIIDVCNQKQISDKLSTKEKILHLLRDGKNFAQTAEIIGKKEITVERNFLTLASEGFLTPKIIDTCVPPEVRRRVSEVYQAGKLVRDVYPEVKLTVADVTWAQVFAAIGLMDKQTIKSEG